MKKIIGVLVFTILFIASCKKTEQLGPDLVGIYGPVTVTQPFAVNTSSVNFATGGQIYFTAQFQNDAVWTITITGATSHAVKTITGISKNISIDNSLWTGTADVVPSFTVENVTATLTFKNSPTLVETITPIAITGKRISDYPTDVLVTNFVVNKRHYDGGPPNHYTIGWAAPYGWPSDYPNIINTDNTYPKPDGDNYLIMSGIPWADPTITAYINNLLIMADSSDFKYGKYFPLYADPDKVYFNIMVCGTNTPYTWLQVTVIEEGANGDINRSINFKPSWTGWKLFSYKYSDLAAGSSTVPNPQKVKGVQLVLLSTAPALPGPSVKIGIDHITFTHNQPYQP
ncbi:MAG: hypothetical protein JWO58_393 [Chitinophagaceae bacterium]|nr:hypothetical protein [Chitinophagaceae bacterium]